MTAVKDPQSTTALIRYGEPGERTLVCMSFCGGGAGAFRQWGEAMPSGVGLSAVCYPGREGRYNEPYVETWDDLVGDAARAVELAAARPYVLFGHSMGGWVAYAVAVNLEGRGIRTPDLLIVSSCNPPDRGLTPRDMFPAMADSDEQLLAWMDRHGVMPAYALGHPELTAMALRLMRADIRLRDTFYHRPSRIAVPIHVLSASDDEVIAQDATERWRALTTGSFTAQTLPGGHFYTPEIWQRLPEHLAALAVTHR